MAFDNLRGIFVSKDDVIETEGKVIECLPNANFKVKLSNGHVMFLALTLFMALVFTTNNHYFSIPLCGFYSVTIYPVGFFTF